MGISKHDLSILRKFKKGSIVSEEDRVTVDIYAGFSCIRTGFDWDTMKDTAKLTKLGLEHL